MVHSDRSQDYRKLQMSTNSIQNIFPLFLWFCKIEFDVFAVNINKCCLIINIIKLESNWASPTYLAFTYYFFYLFFFPKVKWEMGNGNKILFLRGAKHKNDEEILNKKENCVFLYFIFRGWVFGKMDKLLCMLTAAKRHKHKEGRKI